MSGILSSTDAINALAQELGEETPEKNQPDPHHVRYKKGWRPKLNPIQKQATQSKAIYKLYSGERNTGKTYGALHELVDFLYRNDNELAYIIVKEIGMGVEGGAWQKLTLSIIPEWERGLGVITKAGNDFQTKSPYLWISNRHGGWSQVILKSLPVAHQVESKIRGREPGFILVDEAQALESDTYFTSLLMQLGRSKDRKEPSRIVFCCNPEGPSHWLYQRFFVIPFNEDTGEWDGRYAHFHIPYSDNVENLPPRYMEDYVMPAVANDPIMKARLVDGEWVDRPTGNALFAASFVENVHVRGDTNKDQGLLPVVARHMPLIVSWDPGTTHTCVSVEQMVQTTEKMFLLVVDEFDWVGEAKPYNQIVPLVINREVYWEEKMKAQFNWVHVSDSSAFHMYRAREGSFDSQDIEKISREYVEKKGLDKRFIIKMQECPKPAESIEARVRMLNDFLVSSSFLLSATCRRTKEMFFRLECDPENSMKPKKKARYGHNFDALTYGPFWWLHRNGPVIGDVGEVKPQYYRI